MHGWRPTPSTFDKLLHPRSVELLAYQTVDQISQYVALAVALHGVALVIVNITPTPKDNEALSNVRRAGVKLYRAIEVLAGVVGPLVKR